jgi:glycosyltransferase involved in cell wall biosynthesis
MQSNRKAVVAHSGARDHYEVAKALKEQDLLSKLITDIIFPAPINKLVSSIRGNHDFAFSDIKMPLKVINTFIKGYFAKDRLYYSGLLGKQLSLTAYKIAKKNKADLFLYSYDAFEAFTLANKENLDTKKLLFQVHPHPASVRNLLSSEIERVPYARESITNEFEFKFGEKYFKELCDVSLLADKILVSSSFTKETLVENNVKSENITVIPYGVDSNTFSFKKREKKVNGKIKLLFVGSMVQRKGLADLLAAIDLLGTKSLSLTLCGRGFVDTNILKNFSHLNFIVKQNLTLQELIFEMQNADLFIFPSIVEGFGHVILEAMSTGLPVITTNNTCGPDIIEPYKEGLIANIKDPESIAQNIEVFLSNQNLLQEMSQNAALKAKNYTWTNFRRNIFNFYTKTND